MKRRFLEGFDSIANDLANMRETIEGLMTENKNLKARVTKLKAENYALQQYGRQNNIEINGIVNYVANDDIGTESYRNLQIH